MEASAFLNTSILSAGESPLIKFLEYPALPNIIPLTFLEV